MRVFEDAQIVSPSRDQNGKPSPIKAWKSRKIPNTIMGSFSLQGNDEVQDVTTVQMLYESFGRFFPMDVRSASGVHPIYADVYVDVGFNENAQMTDTGHWLLVSTGSIDYLRTMTLAVVTNPESRRLLKLDELDESFFMGISQAALCVGLDFLVAHELGHIFSGHTQYRRAVGPVPNEIAKCMEYEADAFASMRLAEVISSRRTYLDILPRSSSSVRIHSFAVMSMIGAFLVFAGLAFQDRVRARLYPSLQERIASMYFTTMGTAARMSTRDIDEEGLMDAFSVAILAVAPVLEEHSIGKSDFGADAFRMFDPRLNRLPDLKRVNEGVDQLHRQYERFSPLWHQYRGRRAKREIWDAAW